jgi:hypothetical protein
MTATTPTASTWWVEVFVGENDGVSTASATLHTRDRNRVSAHGTARLNPLDRDVPEIGYELATARALSALAHQLLELAADDITGVTEELVSVAGLSRDPGADEAALDPR